MSLPQYPNPQQYGSPGTQRSWEQPGVIPLRPLTIGEILAAAVTVVRRHLLPLGGAAVLAAAVSTAATLALLAGTGSLQTYADGEWFTDILTGASTSPPSGIILASLVGVLVSAIGGPVIAGLATAYAGALALGREGKGAVTERLGGRWGGLLGVAAIVGALVTAGLILVVVPGVIAYLIWVLAGPVMVMERGSVGTSLRRSALLTRGHRGRILGAVAVSMIAGALASTLVSTLVAAVAAQANSVTVLIVTQLVAVIVGGLASAWTGAVVALLYIDVRIRTEHLDQALRSAAAADRAGTTPARRWGT